MRVEIKNKNKIRNYINDNIDENISDEDFNNFIIEIKDMGDYIDEIENDNSMLRRIQEGASMSLTIDDEEYEVSVKFNRLVDSNGIYFEANIDYEYGVLNYEI